MLVVVVVVVFSLKFIAKNQARGRERPRIKQKRSRARRRKCCRSLSIAGTNLTEFPRTHPRLSLLSCCVRLLCLRFAVFPSLDGRGRRPDRLQFSKRDDADRCLAAAIGATDPTHARDSGGSCIFLGSRALHVTRAVDREEVREDGHSRWRVYAVGTSDDGRSVQCLLRRSLPVSHATNAAVFSLPSLLLLVRYQTAAHNHSIAFTVTPHLSLPLNLQPPRHA